MNYRLPSNDTGFEVDESLQLGASALIAFCCINITVCTVLNIPVRRKHPDHAWVRCNGAESTVELHASQSALEPECLTPVRWRTRPVPAGLAESLVKCLRDLAPCWDTNGSNSVFRSIQTIVGVSGAISCLKLTSLLPSIDTEGDR
jgi:hypothetical protein